MALNQHTRITVPLSRDEFEALRDNAVRDYRNPRDQARFILRKALGLECGEVKLTSAGKNSSVGLVLADTDATADPAHIQVLT